MQEFVNSADCMRMLADSAPTMSDPFASTGYPSDEIVPLMQHTMQLLFFVYHCFEEHSEHPTHMVESVIGEVVGLLTSFSHQVTPFRYFKLTYARTFFFNETGRDSKWSNVYFTTVVPQNPADQAVACLFPGFLPVDLPAWKAISETFGRQIPCTQTSGTFGRHPGDVSLKLCVDIWSRFAPPSSERSRLPGPGAKSWARFSPTHVSLVE